MFFSTHFWENDKNPRQSKEIKNSPCKHYHSLYTLCTHFLIIIFCLSVYLRTGGTNTAQWFSIIYCSKKLFWPYSHTSETMSLRPLCNIRYFVNLVTRDVLLIGIIFRFMIMLLQKMNLLVKPWFGFKTSFLWLTLDTQDWIFVICQLFTFILKTVWLRY